MKISGSETIKYLLSGIIGRKISCIFVSVFLCGNRLSFVFQRCLFRSVAVSVPEKLNFFPATWALFESRVAACINDPVTVFADCPFSPSYPVFHEGFRVLPIYSLEKLVSEIFLPVAHIKKILRAVN